MQQLKGKSPEPEEKQVRDTSTVKPSYYLDSSMTMEVAAKRILAGGNFYRWNDTYLLSLIDSLNSKNKASSKYYFNKGYYDNFL